jgi:hypothetical protein
MRTLTIVLLLVSCSSKAQLFDSLASIFRNKYSLDARLESRYSLAGNRLISVSGVRAGLAFQRKLRVGAGLSWLNTTYSLTVPSVETGGESEKRFLKFGYLCLYADVVFHKTKRWQLSVPLQLGTGMAWYQRRPLYKVNGGDTKYLLLLYEPGITVQFKIFKWFGLGADVGYRFVYKPRQISPQLNSPAYAFKILFWPDQLYYQMFPESVISKRFGPAYW